MGKGELVGRRLPGGSWQSPVLPGFSQTPCGARRARCGRRALAVPLTSLEWIKS